jgi:hypothetical protein
MDPNEALQRLRQLLAQPAELITELDVQHVRDLFDALDEWLASGGFLPAEWER